VHHLLFQTLYGYQRLRLNIPMTAAKTAEPMMAQMMGNDSPSTATLKNNGKSN
jgi:hypothetical protein